MNENEKKLLKNKIGKVLLVLVFIFAISMLFINLNTYFTKMRYLDIYPSIDIGDLKKGDLLFKKSFFKSGPLPGYWSHSAIIYDFDENNLPVIIESTSFNVVHYTSLEEFLELDLKKHVMVGRVSGLTEEQKQKTADYASTKIGLPFDQWYIVKQSNGTSYYCSELIWDSYLNGAGIDLNPEPDFTLRFGWSVAPQELFDNPAIEKYNLNVPVNFFEN